MYVGSDAGSDLPSAQTQTWASTLSTGRRGDAMIEPNADDHAAGAARCVAASLI
jgi:hypothetical protein